MLPPDREGASVAAAPGQAASHLTPRERPARPAREVAVPLGLPWATWLLLVASFGIGLAIQVTFWLRRR